MLEFIEVNLVSWADPDSSKLKGIGEAGLFYDVMENCAHRRKSKENLQRDTSFFVFEIY